MTAPLFSVVVPCWNSLKTLPETVESVRSQTFGGWELFLADDGSTDGTAEWAAKLGDPRIAWVPGEHRGRAAARNRGMARASGTWVAFLDADDLWLPTRLERTASALAGHETTGLVYGWAGVISPDGKREGELRAPIHDGPVLEALLRLNFVCTSTAMVRRSLIERIGGFDESLDYPEDWDLWLRAAEAAPGLGIGEELVLYRSGSGFFSRHPEEVRRAQLKALDKARLRNPGLPDRIFRQSAAYIHRLVSDVHSHNGDQARARAALRDSLREDPFHWESYARYAFLCLGNGPISLARRVKRALTRPA